MPKNINTPIPDTEISETGEFCYQFKIPDLPSYHRLVNVLFSYLTRGRFWDRKTGSILDMQQIGWKIRDSVIPCETVENGNDGQIFIPSTIIIKERCFVTGQNCCCPENEQTLNIQNETDAILSDIGTELPIAPPVQPPPLDEDADTRRCRMSKHLVRLCILVTVDIANLIEISEANNADDIRRIAEGTFARVLGIAFARLWIVYQTIAYFAIHLLTSFVATSVALWLNTHDSELTQASFCSNSAREAQLQWHDIITEDTNLTFTQRSWLYLMLQILPFEALFQSEVDAVMAVDFELIQDTYIDDCSCLFDGGDLLLPPNYVGVPMLIKTVTPVNGGTVTDTGNRWQIRGGGDAGVSIEVEEPIFNLSVVPPANIVGFHIQMVCEDILQGLDFGHNVLGNSASHMSTVSFGAALNNFDAGDVFAGVVDTEAPLQIWLTDNTFRREDAACFTDDTGRRLTTWLFHAGDTGNPPISTAVIDAIFIINTTGL